MTATPSTLVLSAVGGGPISRIVDAISKRGNVSISTYNAYSTTEWIRRRGGGQLRSMLARVVVFVFYPFAALARALGADVVIATTNPFWLPNLLLWTRRLHGARVITLVYDVYPDALTTSRFADSVVRRATHALNRAWTRQSDAVVHISQGMQQELMRRYGPPRDGEVIVTGTDTSEFATPPPQVDLDVWVGDRVLVSYIGNAGHVHDVDAVVRLLREVNSAHQGRVAILVSATGARAPILHDGLADLADVWTEPVLSEARWRWAQARTDVAVVALDAAAATASMPSRFFSALGAACAVVAIAPISTDLYQLTASEPIGTAITSGGWAAGLREVQHTLRHEDELRAQQAAAAALARQRFDVQVLAECWENLIHRVTA